MKRIALHDKEGNVRDYTILDDVDYDRLSCYRWFLSSYGYATCLKYHSSTQTSSALYLSREIMNLKSGDTRVVDHINRDTLDNRRCNLRIITRGQNQQNRGLEGNQGSSSGYRGVRQRSDTKKWQARIKIDRKEISLGCFDTQLEAVTVVSEKRRELMPFAIEDNLDSVREQVLAEWSEDTREGST